MHLECLSSQTAAIAALGHESPDNSQVKARMIGDIVLPCAVTRGAAVTAAGDVHVCSGVIRQVAERA